MTPPQPGWYPDPWRTSPWRWWDGRQWSPYTAPGPPTGRYFAGPSPAVAFAGEDRMWRWGRAAVWAYLATQLTQVVLVTLIARKVWSAVRTAFDTMRSNPGGPPPTLALPRGASEISLAVNILSLVTLAAGIAFLVWQHNAASTARDLGYPARRSPALGVGSWFIPVVNLWFPYQALRDCLPPDHPGRASSLAAWLAYLGGGVLLVAAEITVIFAGAYGVLPLACALGAFCAASVIGTRLIKLIRDDHRLAVARVAERRPGG